MSSVFSLKSFSNFSTDKWFGPITLSIPVAIREILSAISTTNVTEYLSNKPTAGTSYEFLVQPEHHINIAKNKESTRMTTRAPIKEPTTALMRAPTKVQMKNPTRALTNTWTPVSCEISFVNKSNLLRETHHRLTAITPPFSCTSTVSFFQACWLFSLYQGWHWE